jgi:glycerol-3-phosphate dehydrogenase (NAD(P)+)
VRAAVVGAGSWGTAFSAVLAHAGNDVTLWARRAELAEAISATGSNPDYLPGVILPAQVTATADLATALDGADLVVLAVPSQQLRANLEQSRALIGGRAIVLSLAKGIELTTTLRMSQVIAEVAGIGPERIAVLSGPNLSAEIAQRQPAACVVACTDEAAADTVAQAVSAPYFRPYTNGDVTGTELGGAIKNIVAIAVGMASAMGFGANTMASLVTRGLAETVRLGVALGADPMTFSGLAGLGDMVATCASPLSRNRSIGERLGGGEDLEHALAGSRMVAEGVRTCEPVLALAQAHGVPMPITEHVVAVVTGQMTPAETVSALMRRRHRPEVHSLGRPDAAEPLP